MDSTGTTTSAPSFQSTSTPTSIVPDEEVLINSTDTAAPAPDTESTSARIAIGSEGQIFTVKAEVWRRSEYLRNALEGPWIESTTRKLDMTDEDPELLQTYLSWLETPRFKWITEPNPTNLQLPISAENGYFRLPESFSFSGDMDEYKYLMIAEDLHYARLYAFGRKVGDMAFAYDMLAGLIGAVGESVNCVSVEAVNLFWEETPKVTLSFTRRLIADICMPKYALMLQWLGDGDIAARPSGRHRARAVPHRPSGLSSTAYLESPRRDSDMLEDILLYNGYCEEFCKDMLDRCRDGPPPKPGSDNMIRRLRMLKKFQSRGID